MIFRTPASGGSSRNAMKPPRSRLEWLRGVAPDFIAALLIGGGLLILLTILEN